MLNRHPLLMSDDFEQTRQVHAEFNLGLEPVDLRAARGRVRSRANFINHADFQVFAYYHDLDVMLTAGEDNPHYWLAIPIVRDQRDASIRLAKRESRLASPSQDDPLRLRGGAPMLGLCIKQDALMNFARPYLGIDNMSPITFDHRLDITQPAFRTLGQIVAMFVEHEAQDPTVLSDPNRLSAFRDSAIATLLHFCPNSHTGQLRGHAAAPGPADVRRVIDYIHANSQLPITLADLVAVSRVPGRTLNAHFAAFKGISPMAYVKRVRLGRSRHLLRTGQVARVTDAALDAGLTHLGRFATDYRLAFGESPSETLATARRH